MAITITKGQANLGALSTLYTLVTDTTGPKIAKFTLDSTWLPAGTILNLSIQTTPDATTEYSEVENVTISNPVSMYQSDATGDMTSGSNVLTLTSAFGTELVVGQRVVVVGAGASGANLDTWVTGVTNTLSYTLNSNAGTTVGPTAQVYAGPAANGIGFEPLWESDSISMPYGFQVQVELVSGSIPPLALDWWETAAG